jgi:hypothetical protein
MAEGVLPNVGTATVEPLRMNHKTGTIAIAEPPVRPSVPQRERVVDREPAHPADLAMLRERVRRMRLPRGEFVQSLPR